MGGVWWLYNGLLRWTLNNDEDPRPPILWAAQDQSADVEILRSRE